MKNCLLSKKTTIISTFISLVLTLGYFFIMSTYNDSLSVEMIIGLVKPVAIASMMMVLVSSFFLFFPEALFKAWLKRIAWWYGLGLFILTASTPVSSSHVLSVDRSQIVFGGMVLLAVVTVFFVIVARRRFCAESSD